VSIYKGYFFFLTTLKLLQYSQIIDKWLQVIVLIFFCLIVTELNKYTYKVLPTSLFSFMKPFVKSMPSSPPLFHQENTNENFNSTNNSGNIYLCLCAPLSQFSVRWHSEMPFCAVSLSTWESTQSYVAFWALEFHPGCFVFSGTCMAPNSLSSQITLCW
jgi:hypothetical protein